MSDNDEVEFTEVAESPAHSPPPVPILKKKPQRRPTKRKLQFSATQDILDNYLETENEDSMINLLHLIWTDDMSVKMLLPRIQLLIRKQIEQRNLTFKVKLVTLQTILQKVLKELILSNESTNVTSWESLEACLKDKELYRTLSKLDVLEAEKTELINAFSNDLEGQSSSSQNMTSVNTADTITLSTTAATTTPTVAVPECKPSLTDENPLETLFGQVPLQGSGSTIQQSISLRSQDQLYTAKSPGEIGHSVIKLEVYPFNEVSHVDKTQWWKHASTRLTCLTLSGVDPLHMTANRLIQQATKQIQQLPGLTKEVRGTSSFGFSRNTQHHRYMPY